MQRLVVHEFAIEAHVLHRVFTNFGTCGYAVVHSTVTSRFALLTETRAIGLTCRSAIAGSPQHALHPIS